MFAHDQIQAMRSWQEHLRDGAVFLSASHQEMWVIPPLAMLTLINLPGFSTLNSPL